MSEITSVAIVGLGRVGTGLAALLAGADIPVTAIDTDAAARAVAASVLSDAGDITITADLAAAAGADLVIEAIGEDAAAKQALLAQVAGIVGETAVIATTTTTLSVSHLALASGRPGRVVGLHPLAPVITSGLVEVVRTVLSDSDAVDAVAAIAQKIGRTPVVVADEPGFIVARLLFGYLNHAVTMFEAGYATREGLDAAMRFGCGYPVGPLAYLDEVGIDVAADILNGLHAQTGQRLHAPAPILKQMIAAGRVGKKSGRGFFTYAEPGADEVVPDELTPAAAAAGAAQPRSVQSVGVVGSGTMATGIMEVFAKAGFAVTFVARSDEKVAGVVAAITTSLDRAVGKGRMAPAERDEVLGRVRGATDVAGLADVDLVVEAVVEDLEVKLDLFRRLDAVCKPGAVLATTTSSLPVVQMAAVTSRPADVIGLHFFNPATIMKLVEVVVPVTTAADVVATAHDICARIKKVAVQCGDRAGFIVNALLFPYLNDAVLMMQRGYADMDTIDTAVKEATGFPMGPFALLDVVGNDVSLAIEETLVAEFRDPALEPAAALRHLVAAGFQGRKTKRGFRAY